MTSSLATRAATGTAFEQLKNVFVETPETRLSVADACLLTGLDSMTCRIFLRWLERDQFLRSTADGLYSRC